MSKITCEKCGRTKEQTMFYTYRDGSKPKLCKECTLMHVNIWDPDTFLWLLEDYDVPWLPWEWDSLREKAYAKDPNKKNDTAVFGKYLSKMKLKQHKDDHWADTDRLIAEHERELEAKAQGQKALQEMYAKQFEAGEISQAQYRTLVKAEIQRKMDKPKPVEKEKNPVGENNLYDEKNFMAEQDIPDLAKDLTEDDKKALVLKWGRYYTPQEWIELETFYNDMINSFDIQDADTRSTLILICKNNLKMNQAIDQGDLEGYQKLARVSDTLRKSAKFTAAQNKEKTNEFIDSVGQLVDYCQKNGGKIPVFSIDKDRDVVDTIIRDLKSYTKSLIYEDPALKRQIEDYLKKVKNNEQQKQDRKQAQERGLDHVEVTDWDIRDYNTEIQAQKQEDRENEFTGTPGTELDQG